MTKKYLKLIDDIVETDTVAWFEGSTYDGVKKTQNVGKKTANALGIFDMSGNVLEWCSDGTGTSGTTTDPINPIMNGQRVFRGGSYVDSLASCAIENINSTTTSDTNFPFGFRVVKRN